MVEALGLRERKKLRTHDAIMQAALELFSERGYHATTVADIAAAAEFAPSTVFSYFPTKEDIVFALIEPFRVTFQERLEGRPAGVSAVEAFCAWALETIPPALATPTLEMQVVRRIVDGDERLQMLERARIAQMEDILKREIARDYADNPDELIGRIIAGAVAGTLSALFADSRPLEVEERENQLKLVFRFIDAGIAAIAPPQASG